MSFQKADCPETKMALKRHLVPSLFQLIVILLLAIFSILSLYFFTRNKRFSIFYKQNPNRFGIWLQDQKIQAIAAIEDIKSWANETKTPLPLFNRPTARRLCVGILSVRRPTKKGISLDYATQTVAALLTRVPLSMQDRIRIILYNVDKNPLSHAEAAYLSSVVQVVSPDYAKVTTLQLPKLIAKSKTRFKENVDYLSSLQHQYAQNCEYSLMLEDDTLASRNWYSTVESIIKSLDPNGIQSNNWHYVKLFSQIHIENWFENYNLLFQLVGFCALLVICLYLLPILIFLVTEPLIKFIHRRLAQNSGKAVATNKDDLEMDPEETVGCTHGNYMFTYQWIFNVNLVQILFIVGLAIFCIVSAGWQNVLLWRPGIYKLSSCSMFQAILYPRSQVKVFIDYLIDHLEPSMISKDLHAPGIIKEQAEKGVVLNFYSWMPDAFQHIGLHSTLNVSKHQRSKMHYSTLYPDDQIPIKFKRPS